MSRRTKKLLACVGWCALCGAAWAAGWAYIGVVTVKDAIQRRERPRPQYTAAE